ncbi:MAG: hypothetical protein AAGA48_11260 [Myxococcota bacterium]
MSERTRRLATYGALSLVVLIGVLPFLYLFDIWPQTRDAVLWIERADPTRPSWFTWTFASRQFHVTLRPLMALSFTATRMVAGVMPWAHRGIDLALHGLAIGLTFAVVRRWSTRASAVGAVLAALVVALHPLARFIVPYLSRRSYSMTVVFALLALLMAPRRTDSVRQRAVKGILAAVLCSASALSHEVGYLAFAICALVAVPSDGTGRSDDRTLRSGVMNQLWFLGASVVLGTGLLIWRASVMGGLGGYAGGAGNPYANVRSSIEGLFPLAGVRLDGEPSSALAFGFGLLVLLFAASAAARDRFRDPAACVALAWIAGTLLLFAPQGVWFVRQVYVLVPALGMLVGTLIGPQVPALGVGVASATLTALGFGVPDWTTHATRERIRQQRTSSMMDEILELAEALPEGGRLVLAIPRWRAPRAWGVRVRSGNGKEVPMGARVPATWVAKVADRRVSIAVMAYGEVEELDPLWTANWQGKALDLTINGSRRVDDMPENNLGKATSTKARVHLPDPAPTVVLYFHDGQTSQHWTVDVGDQL